MPFEGELMNSEGELIAIGPCDIDTARGIVTMRPSEERRMLARERGALELALDDGRTLHIGERRLAFRMRLEEGDVTTLYRLPVIDDVPAHLQAGYREPQDEALMSLVREDEAARIEGGMA